MTTSEIRKKIAESPEKDWFNSVEATILYPHIEFEASFTGLSSIHRFLSMQENGWNEYSSIPNVLNASKQHFANLKRRIESFVNQNCNHSKAQLNRGWRTEQSFLESDSNHFTFDSAYTKFLIELSEHQPNSVNGAFNYLINKNNNLSDRNTFIGSLLAYEFEQKNKAEISGITERREKEQGSLSELRTEFRKQLNAVEKELVSHIGSTKEKYDEYVQKIDNLKSEKEQLFSDWFEGDEENEIIGVKEMFDNFKANKESIFNNWFDGTEKNSGAKNKVAELQKTYEELLKLKEPAEYWKERASRLRTQGWIAFGVLLVFVGIVIWLLGELLWKAPEQIYTSFFEGDKSAAIRWSIIYVTFISFMAFCIRAITKIMFSSFHLARDSEERNTLTYFYLSLLNNSGVGKEERQLIMQSLFSRADTGLLKDDSGPTMPNDLAGKLFGGK